MAVRLNALRIVGLCADLARELLEVAGEYTGLGLKYKTSVLQVEIEENPEICAHLEMDLGMDRGCMKRSSSRPFFRDAPLRHTSRVQGLVEPFNHEA